MMLEGLKEKILKSALEMELDELASRVTELERLYTELVIILIVRAAEHQKNCEDKDCPNNQKTPKELAEGAIANFKNNLLRNVEVNCEINGFEYGDLNKNQEVYEQILREMEGEAEAS